MQTKRIIISGIVLILLCVLTIVIIANLPRDGEGNVVSPKTLYAFKSQEFAKIEVHNPSGGYAAALTDGQVIVEGYENYTLDPAAAQNLVAYSQSLYAYDTVDRSGKDLEKYGMNAPTATGTVTDTSGNVYRVTLGSMMPNGSAYYVMIEGSSAVYAVKTDLLQYFLFEKINFISKQVVSIQADTGYLVDDFSITKNGETYLAFTVMTEDEQAHYNSTGLFMMTAPFQALGKDYNIVSYLETVCNLKAAVVTALDTEPATLAQYGLDEPAIHINYTYSGETFNLYLSEIEDGLSYVYAEGGNVVYRIIAQSINLITLDPFQYVNVNQFKRDINEVTRIILKTQTGENYIYDLSVSGGATTASIGGQPLDGAAFEQFFSLLTNSEVVGLSEKPDGAPAFLTLTFRYRDGQTMPNDTVAFYAMADREYFMEINGSGTFYVSSLYVNKILECAQKLNAGETFSIAY